MRFKFFVVSSLIFFCIGLSYPLEYKDVGFPFKAIVYKSLGITYTESKQVNITKDTAKIFEFTYGGKKYRAEAYVYGAIYVEREGENPLLLSFDIRDFRFSGRRRL